MKTNISKWGNSLAVRIPKSFAEELGLNEESELEIRLKNRQIVLSKSNSHLDELVSGITNENLHKEVETGKITGNEQW
ncbi:AbrB/MazE/SpoVT family DNA-binding domain-containing protein [Candidatus Peregrinibacteria bacterium]|nr:AbrB/MazE/SpoVT family DNA-binding domain-containing protein [Candidatus Peregrinibacteria bacterium]